MSGRRSSGCKRLIMVLMLVLIVMGGMRVQAMASDSHELPPQRVYTSVQIKTGDTLWGIAEEYCGSKDHGDIADYVQELKDMNGIDNECALKPGAYLMLYTLE